MDAEVLARILFWVRQYASGAEGLRSGTVNALLTILQRFTGWYSPRDAAQFAVEARTVSVAGQQAIEGLASQYVAQVHALIHDVPITTPRVTVPPVRNGADLLDVYQRPITAYQRTMSTTADEPLALQAAFLRAEQLVVTDLQLIGRATEVAHLEARGVGKYRRVLHPDRAKSGLSCGLCIAASTRVYNVKELMPMHGNCHCTVVEVGSVGDPGDTLNDDVLRQLYIDSGGTSGPQLKRTRYSVGEHGEYGPALSRHGTPIKTSAQLGANDPIGRAIAELSKLEPALKLLEQKAASGQDVSGPLEYQLERIAKLTRIIAAA